MIGLTRLEIKPESTAPEADPLSTRHHLNRNLKVSTFIFQVSTDKVIGDYVNNAMALDDVDDDIKKKSKVSHTLSCHAVQPRMKAMTLLTFI